MTGSLWHCKEQKPCPIILNQLPVHQKMALFLGLLHIQHQLLMSFPLFLVLCRAKIDPGDAVQVGNTILLRGSSSPNTFTWTIPLTSSWITSPKDFMENEPPHTSLPPQWIPISYWHEDIPILTNMRTIHLRNLQKGINLIELIIMERPLENRVPWMCTILLLPSWTTNCSMLDKLSTVGVQAESAHNHLSQ